MAKKRKRTVTRNYIDNPDVISKRVVKKGKKRTIIKEKADTLAEREYLNPAQTKYITHDREPYKYNDKTLWSRKYKSKVDNTTGEETKRNEKIVYDDGNQMKKRKQRKIKFGKNKGKIKVKTVHYKKGKKTKKVEYKDTTDKSKLKKGGAKYRGGGFLEGPTPILFED